MSKEPFEKPKCRLEREKKWADNESEKTNAIFKIRPTNEEQNDLIITIGDHLATENHFKTREEAENFIKAPKWETILALISEIMQIHESNKHSHEEKS